MMAQVLRFAIGLLTAVLAILAYLLLAGSWAAWAALLVIFIVGGCAAEWTFRKLATPETIRADLEDRVRNQEQ
jgi:O-antigen ligase